MAMGMSRSRFGGSASSVTPFIPGVGNGTGKGIGKSPPKPRPRQPTATITRRQVPRTSTSRVTPTKISNSGSSSSSRPSSAPVSNVPAAAPGPIAPIVPDIGAYLAGDVDYQNQIRQFDKTLADFTADSSTRKVRTEADYGEGKRNMETQRGTDLQSLKDDFASRGLLSSGLYTGRIGEYETDYRTQIADLERQFNQAVQDISNQGTQFTREQDLSKESARQDAIRRRAQQYGL